MYKFIYLFIYLWLCWVFVSVQGLSLVVASGGHSSSRCVGLSLSRPLLLWSTSSRCAGSVVVAHGPSCSAACGIFPDQGSNPCPLHWQADSQPLRHQGSPPRVLLRWIWWKMSFGCVGTSTTRCPHCCLGWCGCQLGHPLCPEKQPPGTRVCLGGPCSRLGHRRAHGPRAPARRVLCALGASRLLAPLSPSPRLLWSCGLAIPPRGSSSPQ